MKFSKELESEYNKEPDLWFKVSLMLLFGVFVGIQIVHGVVSEVRGDCSSFFIFNELSLR
jgi:hypothetical protein